MENIESEVCDIMSYGAHLKMGFFTFIFVETHFSLKEYISTAQKTIYFQKW